MAITTINIGAAPNDHTGDTIRDSFDICNLNFQDLDTTKFDIPTGTDADYLDGEGTPTIFPTIPTQTSQLFNDGVDGIHPFLDTLDTAAAASQMRTYGRNSTGATLYKGYIVYISGATGNRPNFTKAQANSEATSAGTFGVVIADIPNNSDGYVCTIGALEDLDNRPTATNPFTTDTLSAGDTLYLSPTIAGYVTNVKPYAPNHLVYIGKVVRVHPTLGTNVYRIQNGYELDEIHDVAAQTPTNRDLLMYNSSTSLWENTSFYTKAVGGVQYFTDFDNTQLISYFPQVVSGTAASTYRLINNVPNQSANQIGICQYQTGITATGYAMHITETSVNAMQFQFGGGTWFYESYIEVETLSNATDRYRFLSGFGDNAAGTADGNNAFFTYDEGGTANGTTASANWQCVTSNNSVRTLTTTSVPVTTNWVKLRIIVNAAATQITYFIDGTLVATHTTNIPTFALGRRFKVKQGIFKTIGTTNRYVFCDYLLYENNLTTLR